MTTTTTKPARIKKFKGWDPTKERETYDENFYEKHRKYYEKGLPHFADWLESNVQFESIVDVGCGQGEFIKSFVGKKTIKGVDFSVGAKNGLVIPSNCYVDHDLTTPWKIIPGEFDVVVSLETYEHIPADFEDVYLKNLHDLNGKYMIVSCAEPHQIGRHHYNSLGKDEMIVKIEGMKKYSFNETLTKSFSKIKKLASFYRKNTAVFVRNDLKIIDGNV